MSWHQTVNYVLARNPPRPSPPGALHPLPMRVVPERKWSLSHRPDGIFLFLACPSLPIICKMTSLGEGGGFDRAQNPHRLVTAPNRPCVTPSPRGRELG